MCMYFIIDKFVGLWTRQPDNAEIECNRNYSTSVGHCKIQSTTQETFTTLSETILSESSPSNKGQFFGDWNIVWSQGDTWLKKGT